MLNRVSVSLACLATVSLPTLAGPEMAPPVTFDETVPASLVSPNGLEHRALGEALFGSLPTDQQAMIAAAGGIGPRQSLPMGVGVLRLDAPAELLGDAADLIDAETLAMLRPEHIEMFKNLSAMAQRGEPIPAMCLAPDTDPKVAAAFHAFFEAIQGGQERYQYGDRWSRTALSGGSLVIGEPTTVTYSYVPDGTVIPNFSPNGLGISSLHSWLDGLYGSGTWEGLFDTVFARWGFLTGLDYVYEPNDDGVDYSSDLSARGVSGVRGDVRIGATALDGNSGVLAFNFFPDYGDMVIDAGDSFFNFTQQQHRRFKNVVSHEHGHGLGASHVCPANGTKLMEPFINTNFVGPQLDDRLFGQRAYGDNLEDNDTQGTATDLGSMDPGGSYSYPEISIDDNSDVDYFGFTATLPVEITVSLTPAAGVYLNGAQLSNGSCSNGTSTDYQTVHDLAIEFLDAAGNVLATVNNSPAGVVETAVFQFNTPGTHAFRVIGDTTNNIQLYDIDVSSELALAPLTIEFTSIPDSEITPDQSQTVTTAYDLHDDILVSAPEIEYSINGGSATILALTNQGGGVYDTTLPAIPCGSSLTYQVNAEGFYAGPIVLGPNTVHASLGVTRTTLISDDFETDQGWTVSGTIFSNFFGLWERLVPSAGTTDAPLTDGDGSGTAWITGDAIALNHVSGGNTILTSPVFDMSSMVSPVINLKTWFNDSQGATPGVNEFILEISNDNGSNWVNLDTFGPNNADSVGGWIDRVYTVLAVLTPTSTMRIRAIAEDANGSNFYEAGIDGFSIDDINCESDCPADTNGDGILDNGDIGDFIGLFLAGDLAADFNGDGFLDNGDIGAFIDAFLAGC